MTGAAISIANWDRALSRICFIDVETTGLWDPAAPPILLEVAAVVTDRNLVEIGRYSALIRASENDLARTNPFVVSMHLQSGLWRDLKAGLGTDVSTAEEGLCRMLERTDPGDGRPVIWAGASPSALDRPLLRRAMPKFDGMFCHRLIDVSSLKLVLQNYSEAELRAGKPMHRALSDCFGAMEILRACKNHLAKIPCPAVA